MLLKWHPLSLRVPEICLEYSPQWWVTSSLIGTCIGDLFCVQVHLSGKSSLNQIYEPSCQICKPITTDNGPPRRTEKKRSFWSRGLIEKGTGFSLSLRPGCKGREKRRRDGSLSIQEHTSQACPSAVVAARVALCIVWSPQRVSALSWATETQGTSRWS